METRKYSAEIIGAAAIGLGYELTRNPSIAGGDSAELTAAIALGGVVHPPGYPLYTLLGSLLPQLNLLSCICATAAAFFQCLAVRVWTGSRIASAVAALTFALSPLIWQYAITAEVFALNNAIVAVMLFIAAVYDRTRDARWLNWGALMFGLGMSNHQTCMFVGVPIVAWALWTARATIINANSIAKLVGFFTVGLLPYLWLPIAGRRNPDVTWGATNTLRGFWVHVLRREYGTLSLAPHNAVHAHPLTTVQAWATDLQHQIGWLGIALAIFGLIAAARTSFGRLTIAPVVLSVGVMALLGNVPVEKPLFREIIARFWQQPDLFVCAWCGLGAVALARLVKRPWVGAAAGTVLVLLQTSNISAMDRSDSLLVKDYGESILRAAPQNALLITKGDLITNSARYLQSIRHRRPDVRIVDQELLSFPWYRPRFLANHPDVTIPEHTNIKQLIDANFDKFPIVICGGIREDDHSADAAYELWPLGLCDSVHRKGNPPNIDDWIRESDEALPRVRFAGQARPEGSWEQVVWGDYWEVRDARAVQLINYAGHDPSRREYLGKAAEMLTDVAKGDPEAPLHVWRNLATALGRYGLETSEQRHATAEAWRHYLLLAPKDDPMVPGIEHEIENLGP